MGRKSRQIQYANPVIECPLDLDELIMSPLAGSSDFLNVNLNVSDDILSDAISLSAYAGWLLTLDVFRRLSLDIRTSLLQNLNFFSPIVVVCFLAQVNSLSASDPLRIEVEKFLEANPSIVNRNALGLYNPLTRLNNPTRAMDLSILSGESFLRRAFFEQIEKFLKSRDMSDIDFSSSVFLPEILHPRFFLELSEGERHVVLRMCEKYFPAVASFSNWGWAASSMMPRGRKANPPQALLKWVMMSDECSIQTKMLAYRQFLKEIERMKMKSSSGPGGSMGYIIGRILDNWKMMNMEKRQTDELIQKEISTTSLMEWLNKSEGLFESFELDCTLHNLDATIFWPEILNYPDIKMAAGMMDFQDDDIKIRLMKEIGDSMTAFR